MSFIDKVKGMFWGSREYDEQFIEGLSGIRRDETCGKTLSEIREALPCVSERGHHYLYAYNTIEKIIDGDIQGGGQDVNALLDEHPGIQHLIYQFEFDGGLIGKYLGGSTFRDGNTLDRLLAGKRFDDWYYNPLMHENIFKEEIIKLCAHGADPNKSFLMTTPLVIHADNPEISSELICMGANVDTLYYLDKGKIAQMPVVHALASGLAEASIHDPADILSVYVSNLNPDMGVTYRGITAQQAFDESAFIENFNEMNIDEVKQNISNGLAGDLSTLNYYKSIYEEFKGRNGSDDVENGERCGILMDLYVNTDADGFSDMFHRDAGMNSEVARKYIEHGGDPNYVGDGGITPLKQAANAEALDVLLNAGADVNLQDPSNKQTALHFATDEALIRKLLDNGADPFIEDRWGDTPWNMSKGVGAIVQDHFAQAQRARLTSEVYADQQDLKNEDIQNDSDKPKPRRKM